MSTAKEKSFVSCILYLHNDGSEGKRFFARVCKVMDDHFEKYEMICVNDGCTDDTISQIKAFMKEDGDSHVVHVVNLSYYQGVETAMNAGRDLAVGDFVFEFDSCLMDFDESVIMEVYYRSLEGYDIVAAAPKHYVSLSSKLFYFVYNADNPYRGKIRQERFRIISRRAINRVNQLNTYVPYRKVLYANCGLRMDTIVYDNKTGIVKARTKRNRQERSTRNDLAADAIIIFTDLLERLSMVLSIVFGLIMLFTLGYIIVSIFSETKPVEGWASTMLLMSIGFGMLFVVQTLIFKYLSVILNMMFKKQRYVIEGVEKLNQ